MKRWWDEWPDRLKYELQALEDAGIPYKRDEQAFKEGRLELELCATVAGEKIELRARFPDLYPYFRFEVFAPKLSLLHHQNPLQKNLCLVGRGTENWFVDDTLAKFVTEQLPDVLKAGRASSNNEEIEIPQGEPFTDYYEYGPGAILVDSAWHIPDTEHNGRLELGFRSIGQFTSGAVLSVHGASKLVLAEAHPAIQRLFPQQITANWIRLGTPIVQSGPYNFAHAVFEHYPALLKERVMPIKNNLNCHVIGVIFPDELEYGRKRDAWVFLIRLRSPRNAKPYRATDYLIREARSGKSDLLSRAPELNALAQKKVAVFGLGCVGAPSAIELARSGIGELRLVDPDFVEAGTVVRWPFGITSAGSPKAEVLHEFVETQYPFTSVKSYVHRLGAAFGNKSSDFEILDEVLAGADLIYDATAEVGVRYFLAGLARKRAIPYVMAWATNGGWGGLIARFVPGQTKGCWSCLANARTSRTIPSPPEKAGDQVQPLGCAAPTFTGTAFDIAHVSLSAVRLAVATLCRGVEGAYPDFDWDVGVLSLRKEDGTLVPPKWETFQLSRHLLCEACKDSQ